MSKIHRLKQELNHVAKLRSEIYAVLSISAKVKLVEPNAIPRSMGKAVRIIDKRNI